MATIPQDIVNVVSSYVKKIAKNIPIKKAILFGSYAKGTINEHSDIDIAIFSEYFSHLSRVEGIQYLLAQAREYDADLQPLAFDDKEYEEQLGLTAEIIQTGVEIYPS